MIVLEGVMVGLLLYGGALSPDAARELRRNLNRLSVALESPGDIVDRIVYSVRPFHTRAHVSLRMQLLGADAMAWTSP